VWTKLHEIYGRIAEGVSSARRQQPETITLNYSLNILKTLMYFLTYAPACDISLPASSAVVKSDDAKVLSEVFQLMIQGFHMNHVAVFGTTWHH
jgi:hypothetical protein